MAADEGKPNTEKRQRRGKGGGGKGGRDESEKKGGKGGRENRPPRRKREDLPMVEDPQAELDKLMAQEAPQKPNRDGLDRQIATIQAEIDGHKQRTEQITKELDAIKEKTDAVKKKNANALENIRVQLRELKKKIVGTIEERKRISTSIDEIRTKKTQMDDAIKKQKAHVGKFTSNESIDEEIKKIEEYMAHNSLSVKDEKDFIQQIKALNKKRDDVKTLEIMEGKRGDGDTKLSLPELFDARKVVDDKLAQLRESEKTLAEQLTEMRDKTQVQQDKFPKLSDERKELREKISSRIGSIRELRDAYSKQEDAWYDNDRLVKNLKWQIRQKNIKEREERQKEWEEKNAGAPEEVEGEPKEKEMDWDLAQRIAECEQLIVFLHQYVQKAGTEAAASASSPGKIEGAYESTAGLEDDPLGLNAYMVEEVVSKRSKKKEKKKAHTAAKSSVQAALQEGSVEIKLTLEMVQQFTSMALPIPSTSEDAAETIELLKAKKDYYTEQGEAGKTLKEVIKMNKSSRKKDGKKDEANEGEKQKKDPLDEAVEAAAGKKEDEEPVVEGAAPSKEALQAEALKHFEAADKNGDGVLTKSEIKQYMTKVEPELKGHFGVTSGGWKQLWDHMDKDCDGSLTVNEWEALYVQRMGVVAEAPVAATKGGFGVPKGGAKARKGGALTDAEKKARGLLYDTSKATAVREDSSDDDEDEDAAAFEGGDPFDGI